MRPWLLLGAWAAAACSAVVPPASKPAPGPGPGPTPTTGGGAAPKPSTSSGIEVARLGAGDLRFLVARHDSLTLQYPTGSQTQVLDRNAWVRVLLTSGDGVTIVLDSLRSPGGLSADSLKPLDGIVWTGTLERGRLGTLRPSRDVQLAEQLALPLVTDLLPTLPVTGVKTGATWRDSTQNAQRVAGAELPMSTVTDYDAHDAPGKHELELTGSSKVRAKGTSTTFGQPIDISADGMRRRTWRLTPAGQLTGAEGSDSLTMSLDVPSVGQTVPATQIGRFTATRITVAR